MRVVMNRPGRASEIAHKRVLDPVPHGFKQAAPRMTMKELRVRHSRSADVIRRWCREAGVQPRKSAIATYKPAPASRNIEQSVAGRAVDECLRKYGPVYRCDVAGAPLPDGFFWNRGGRVLSDDDVIARAEALGWDRNAWRRAA